MSFQIDRNTINQYALNPDNQNINEPEDQNINNEEHVEQFSGIQIAPNAHLEQNNNINEEHNDPGLEQALNRNNSIAHDDIQAQRFSLNHQVVSGRDWIFHESKGMQEIAQNAVEKIKDRVGGQENINNINQQLTQNVNTLISKNISNEDKEDVLNSLGEIKNLLKTLKSQKNTLTSGIHNVDPDASPMDNLKAIRKTLRAFRYETQSILNNIDNNSKKMDFFEGKLRAIQNFFTFSVKHHVKEQDIKDIISLENQIATKVDELNAKIKNLGGETNDVRLPENFKLLSTLEDTLEISHLTNDQIRKFQDEDNNKSYIYDLLKQVSEKGGKRTVNFTCGVGALIGLGFPATVTAGIRAGGRFTMTGEVVSKGKGQPLSVTFRIGGGLDAKLLAKFGKGSRVEGLNVNAGANALLTHFTTLTYPTLDDLVKDADRCKLATSRPLGTVLLSPLKYIGSKIGMLGVKAFRSLGRHGGEILQSNNEYLNTLKVRGVVGQLDSILAKRANPIIVTERNGMTGHLNADLSASIGLGKVADLKGQASANIERDFKVEEKFFAPIGKVIVNTSNIDEVKSLLRQDPITGTMAQLPDHNENLADKFQTLIDETKNHLPKNKDAWRSFANQIRTLMLGAEERCKSGLLPRDQADRLINRFSNPEIKIPQDIYREYFMEGGPASKPAKIRSSGEIKLKAQFLKDTTSNITQGLANVTKSAADSFIKGAADGAITKGRGLIGLNNSVQYRYSSEKPADPQGDPRPWENVTKTTHEISFSDSLPMQSVIELVTRIIQRNYETPENKDENSTETILKDITKSSAKQLGKSVLKGVLVKLLIAGAKESAKAALIKWLSDPEHVEQLIKFATKATKASFKLVSKAVMWAVEHPGTALTIYEQAKGYINGSQVLSEIETLKTLSLNYVDGNLESLNVSSQSNYKTGVDLEPLGVGVGVGIDVSYSIKERTVDRSVLLNPTLTTLLEKTEGFLLSKTELRADNNCEQLKNYLARNLDTIRGKLEDFKTGKNKEIYDRARELAQNDLELLSKLEQAWNSLNSLNEHSPKDQVVKTMHDFLVMTTLAYRTSFSE